MAKHTEEQLLLQFPQSLRQFLRCENNDDFPDLTALPMSTIFADLYLIYSEHRFAKELKERGLFPKKKLFFSGAKGTGKCFAAKSLAKKLDFPFITIDAEFFLALLQTEGEDFVGELFDAMEKFPAVYFFSGLDKAISIYCEYNHNNSFLVKTPDSIFNLFSLCLERHQSNSLIIFSLNTFQSGQLKWDPSEIALSVYDACFSFEKPNDYAVKELIEKYLEKYDCEKDWTNEQLALNELGGFSYRKILSILDECRKLAELTLLCSEEREGKPLIMLKQIKHYSVDNLLKHR
jgi:AAA+ superfamily predicted ATPase